MRRVFFRIVLAILSLNCSLAFAFADDCEGPLSWKPKYFKHKLAVWRYCGFRIDVAMKMLFAILLLTLTPFLATAQNNNYRFPTHVVSITRHNIQNHCETLLMSTEDIARVSDLEVDYVRSKVNPDWYKIEAPLTASNKFALMMYEALGVVTPEQREYYLSLAHKLDPEQIQIIEVHELDLDGSLYAQFQEDWFSKSQAPLNTSLANFYVPVVPHDFPKKPRLSHARNVMALRKSNLWLVRGDSQFKHIPWMIEFPDVASALNIEGLVWEIGRAATTAPHLFDKNVSILAALALNEALLKGEDISKATLTAHATTRENAIFFKRKFKMKTLSKISDEPFHEVVGIPLVEAFKQYRMGETFKSVKVFAEITGLGDLEATTLLLKASHLRQRLVTTSTRTLSVQDFSPSMAARYLDLLKPFELPAEKNLAALNYLRTRWRPIDMLVTIQSDMNHFMNFHLQNGSLVVNDINPAHNPDSVRNSSLIPILVDYLRLHNLTLESPELLKLNIVVHTGHSSRGAVVTQWTGSELIVMAKQHLVLFQRLMAEQPPTPDQGLGL